MPGIVLAVGKHPSCSPGVNAVAGEIDTKYMGEKYLISSVVRAMKEKKIDLFQTQAMRHRAQESLNCDLGLIPRMQLGSGSILFTV